MATDSACDEMTRLAWSGGVPTPSSRLVAQEAAIALTYNGSTFAVMMASPSDLRDFGIGFTITEGIAERAEELRGIDLIESDLGVEIRMWLDEERIGSVHARRRAIMGPVGCGLCGIESLEQACPVPLQVASEARYCAHGLRGAVRELAPLPRLNHKTRAVHAAAFFHPTTGGGWIREDVGRHNALDKLAGALMQKDVPRGGGAVLLTSRVSVEMVQKTARIGVPVLIAVSAPTTLAIRTAHQAGITLIAVARDDGYEIFTHPDRLVFLGSDLVAA